MKINRIRELNGLIKLPFKVDEKYIITYKQNGTSEDIKIVPFWEYFFELAITYYY